MTTEATPSPEAHRTDPDATLPHRPKLDLDQLAEPEAPKAETASAVFERTIDRDILRGETIRTVILVITAIIAGLLSTQLVRFFPGDFDPRIEYPLFTWIVAGVAAVFVVYFITIRLLIQRWTKQGQQNWLQLLRYTNALGEITLITAVLAVPPLFGDMVKPPIYVMFSAGVFVYFFFITLSVFQFNFRLSAFTGIIAAIEYLGLALYLMENSDPTGIPPLVNSPSAHIVRALLLLLTGLVAGFATGQLRRSANRSLEAVQERNRVTGIFGQHVSHKIVDTIINRGETTHSPELRHVCVMFFDIRDFAAYTENHSPNEVVAYLNAIFGMAVEIVNRHGGIINKFLGDGFMAIFGAPLSDGHDSQSAVNAALEMVEWIAGRIESGRLPKTRVGIGIHTGPAITGNIGAATRQEYTVIGEVVNVAARIEALNKQFGSQVLVSEQVKNKLKDHAPQSAALGTVLIKGGRESVAVYRLA